MSVAVDAGGGFLAPIGFADSLLFALKAVDSLFSDRFVNLFESDNGNTYYIPSVDDAGSSAEVLEENQPDTRLDPTLLQTALPKCPTYRSHEVRVSVELSQDSGFDIGAFLTRAFALRLDRKVGADLVASLYSSAAVGATAIGSAGNTGGTENGSASVGTDDLLNLMGALDSAYLNSPKTAWFMNWSTLLSLWRLKDRDGRPCIRPEFDEDRTPVLYGFPVAVCPSFDSIGPAKKPIAFGDGGYFAVRVVKNRIAIARFWERYVELGILAFKALLRCNGALVCAGAATPPIQVLQNA
jgi:HK97 family phage major capsid protein